MSSVERVAFIGNALPRRCGIATFTTDLEQAIADTVNSPDSCVVAMTDSGQAYDYPASVRFQIHDLVLKDYARAADFLNAGRFDVVCLQHEFGIFGGDTGEYILALVSRLTVPLVTTLHTVLAAPSARQRAVLGQIIDASAKVVVMAEKARRLLVDIWATPPDKIEVIPHGVPDFLFVEPDAAKLQHGFAGRSVILTFGLLSPNKGVEVMLDAMPAILARCPDAVYVVLGATHPHLVRSHGEAYREGLMARADALGVAEHVVFLNRFVDQATLLNFIAMSDVYVTPYLSEAQMTSGTLAYSFGLGKAVVSTPYWHAAELLTDGRGILVPFGDSPAVAEAVAGLLSDPVRRLAMRRRAYEASRPMTWARTAEHYLATFEEGCRAHRLRAVSVGKPGMGRLNVPELRLGHLQAMCDATGLFQHAVYSVADRAHGYCVDDNARALVLACNLAAPGEAALLEPLAGRFAAFIQHAWNPDLRRFRNFMSFERRWLEPMGSEDSHGRTLWALGACARDDRDPSRRRWAAGLFGAALEVVAGFSSPRAWAFTLLGLDGFCAARPGDDSAEAMRLLLAERLMAIRAATATADWPWFESGLAYDNARLPQALLVTGAAMNAPAMVAAGLQSLAWLVTQQRAPGGHFRAVGSHGFDDYRQAPRPFDQQPLEATAMISACLVAAAASGAARWHGEGEIDWLAEARRAFAWFHGENDLSAPMVDLDGGCRDGLHPDRPNENKGGESVVSYLLSVADMRRLAREAEQRAAPVSARRPLPAISARSTASFRGASAQRSVP